MWVVRESNTDLHPSFQTKRHLAACAIQGLARQMLSKDIFAETRRQFRLRTRAARKIQKFVRTVNTRLSAKLKRMRDFVNQMRVDAAVLIQQWIRREFDRHVAVRMMFEALRKNRAAIVIQNNFRAYLSFVAQNKAKFAFLRIVAERRRLDEVKEFRRRAINQQRTAHITHLHTLNASALVLQRAIRRLKNRRHGARMLTEKKKSVEHFKGAVAAEVVLRASAYFHRGRAERLALVMKDDEEGMTDEDDDDDDASESEGKS